MVHPQEGDGAPYSLPYLAGEEVRMEGRPGGTSRTEGQGAPGSLPYPAGEEARVKGSAMVHPQTGDRRQEQAPGGLDSHGRA